MRIYLFTLSLSLLLLTIQGCRHGTTDSTRIHAVSPTGVAGAPGAIIEFSIDFDATGTATFAWNFDHGAEPATSTAESPTVTLLDPGTYEAYVELRVDDTLVQHFDFEYTVASPPEITAVTPEGEAGLVRGIVRFEAVFEGDFDALEWEFGDGATVREQDEQAVEVRLRDPGTYTGVVRSVYGSASSDDFPFEYTVTAPIAPTWTTHDIALAELSTSKKGVAMTEHLGRIAIAFTAPDGVRLALAKTASPCCPGDWDIHLIDPLGNVRSPQSLISQDDRLMLAYRQNRGVETDQLRVAVAQVAEPSSEDDWLTMRLESADTGAAALLKRPNEPPVLIGMGLPKGWNFWVALQGLPESSGDWEMHSILPDTLAGILPISQVTVREWNTGYVVAATREEEFGGSRILFAQTAEHDPASSDDWTVHLADSLTMPVSTLSLLPSDDDRPALLYAGPPFPASIGLNLILLHASSEEPETAADWTWQVLAFELPRLGAGLAATIAERAIYVHADPENNQLNLYRQIRENRKKSISWEASIVTSANIIGQATTLMEFEGSIAVAFIDSNNGFLRLSLSSGPY